MTNISYADNIIHDMLTSIWGGHDSPYILSFNEEYSEQYQPDNKLCTNVTINLREFDMIFETIMLKPAPGIVEILLINWISVTWFVNDCFQLFNCQC